MKVRLDNDEIIEGTAVSWDISSKELVLIDQRLLPEKTVFLRINSLEDTFNAIKQMAVRGAPAIGLTGVFGLLRYYFDLLNTKNLIFPDNYIITKLKKGYNYLLESRPTAVDLFNMTSYFVDKVITENLQYEDAEKLALEIFDQNKNECYNIGVYGSDLIKTGMNILTHCNAGALATADYGTALAPIRIAKQKSIDFHVWVDETRPRLQGGRLTSWELANESISFHVISDNAAGYLMSKGLVDLIIVGADRVTGDGWVANKIGTFTLSVLAKHFSIPFYVAIPWSTFIPNMSRNDAKIEERSPSELLFCPQGHYLLDPRSMIVNPAFDWTPVEHITGFITPAGILRYDDLFTHYENMKNSVF